MPPCIRCRSHRIDVAGVTCDPFRLRRTLRPTPRCRLAWVPRETACGRSRFALRISSLNGWGQPDRGRVCPAGCDARRVRCRSHGRCRWGGVRPTGSAGRSAPTPRWCLAWVPRDDRLSAVSISPFLHQQPGRLRATRPGSGVPCGLHARLCSLRQTGSMPLGRRATRPAPLDARPRSSCAAVERRPTTSFRWSSTSWTAEGNPTGVGLPWRAGRPPVLAAAHTGSTPLGRRATRSGSAGRSAPPGPPAAEVLERKSPSSM